MPHFATTPAKVPHQMGTLLTAKSGCWLQRKCACGTSLGPTGECEDCRKNQESKEDQFPEPPPIVYEVLGSPGQQLDATTRAFMEPRFGHDFANVRIHTDARAAESARSVGALAYTVGQNIVFGKSRYTPNTHTGRELLGHELAHTIQQRNASGVPASADRNDVFEASANAAGRMVANGNNVSRSLPACGHQIQRSPDVDLRWKNSVQAARYRGQIMANRIRKHGILSREARAKINQELAYFEGDAKEVYLREVRPILRATVQIEMPEELVEKRVPSVPAVTSSLVQPDPGKISDEQIYAPLIEAKHKEAEEKRAGPEYAPVREYETEMGKLQNEFEAEPELTEQETEQAGMRAYYLSTRQSQLEHVAATRTQLRQDVYHMTAKQIHEQWEQGRQTWVTLASSHGHGLGHQQFFHIWLADWEYRYNAAKKTIDRIQKSEAARDVHVFLRKMDEFWDTGMNNRDAFGSEYRKAVELTEVGDVMLRTAYDALWMAHRAESRGEDITLQEFDQMVLNHAALWGAFAEIAGAYAAAYGGYSPSKISSKVPTAAKGPSTPTPVRPPGPDLITPSRPVAGFGRDIEPAPQPIPAPDPYVTTQMPNARVVQGNQPTYGNVKPAFEAEGQQPATPSRRVAGFKPPPKDIAEKPGLIEAETGPREYVKKEYLGDVGAAGEQQSRYHVNVQLDEHGMMDADFVLRGGGKRSGSLLGKDEFLAAKQHFEQKNGPGSVKGAHGRWSGGDNLDTFNTRYKVATDKGLPHDEAMIEAARKTKTGEWANAAGFNNIKITKAEGSPGAFTNVEVEFTQ
jgi:Domain of unknown function (DUF4157)